MELNNIPDALKNIDRVLTMFPSEEPLYKTFLSQIGQKCRYDINNIVLSNISGSGSEKGFYHTLEEWSKHGIGVMGDKNGSYMIDENGNLMQVYDISDTLCTFKNIPSFDEKYDCDLHQLYSNVDSLMLNSKYDALIKDSIKYAISNRIGVGYDFEYTRNMLSDISDNPQALKQYFQTIIDETRSIITAHSTYYNRMEQFIANFENEEYALFLPELEEILKEKMANLKQSEKKLETEVHKEHGDIPSKAQQALNDKERPSQLPVFEFKTFPRDGNLDILSCKSEDKFIAVPHEIKGHKVTRLSADCFKTCQNLSAVILSENIKSIIRGAIPQGVTIAAPEGSFAAKYAESYGYHLKTVDYKNNNRDVLSVDKSNTTTTQSNRQPFKRTKPVSKEERSRELMKESREGLSGLKSVDKLKAYLDTMSCLYYYSASNIMLVHQQLPGASYISTYKTWQEKYGRNVQKGENGIQILVPIVQNRDVPMFDMNGKKIVDGRGHTQKESREFIKFEPIYVYDVSQTEGERLPYILSRPTPTPNDVIESLKTVSPFSIALGQIPERAGAVHSFFDKIRNQIVVDINLPPEGRVAAALKETFMATYRNEELSILSAYVISRHFGINLDSSYLQLSNANWSQKNIDEIKSCLENVQNRSSDIIVKLEKTVVQLTRRREFETKENHEQNNQEKEVEKRELKKASEYKYMSDRIAQATAISNEKNKGVEIEHASLHRQQNAPFH